MTPSKSKATPPLVAVVGSLGAIIGAIVAVVAVSTSSDDTGMTIGLLVGLGFLLVALGVVVGLMRHARGGPGQ